MKNLTFCALLSATVFVVGFSIVKARGAINLQNGGNYFVYIGPYTGSGSDGIYLYKLSVSTGKLVPMGLAVATTNPTFLAIHPNHRFLYAINEINQFQGKKSGSVSAFSIDRATGKLKLLNAQPTGDPGPCHLSVDATGKYLLVANYGIGSVASFPIEADGSLGSVITFLPQTGHSVDAARQKGPHAHSIYLSPDNRFAVSPDLGTDQLYVYKFDATKGTLTPNTPPFAMAPLGSGPRHFAFGPGGKFGYVIEEMGSSLTTFSYDAARGVLTSLSTVTTLPSDFKGVNHSAEVFFLPNGRFLYGSNRGMDSITVFSVDPVKGLPTAIQYVPTQGKTPRGFGIDPTGHYLIAANQDSNNLVVFRIDRTTGKLTPTGQIENIQQPASVSYEPAP